MAGSRLEGWRGKADQVEPRHQAGELAKMADKGGREVKVKGALPIHRAGKDRHQARYQGQACRHGGNRHGQARNPLHTGQVDRHEQQHQATGQEIDRYAGQVPALDGRGRQQRRQPTGGHPAPPIAGAGQVGQHRRVGAKGLATGGGNAADAGGPHQHQFGPAGRGGPAQQQAHDQQGHGGAALAQDVALAGKQRGDQKQALVAAAHGQGGGAHPTQRARMR